MLMVVNPVSPQATHVLAKNHDHGHQKLINWAYLLFSRVTMTSWPVELLWLVDHIVQSSGHSCVPCISRCGKFMYWDVVWSDYNIGLPHTSRFYYQQLTLPCSSFNFKTHSDHDGTWVIFGLCLLQASVFHVWFHGLVVMVMTARSVILPSRSATYV